MTQRRRRRLVTTRHTPGYAEHLKIWQSLAWMRTNWPILYTCRSTIAINFQLNGNKSETAQDIDLKFSSFAHHMCGLDWQENFIHYSISGSVAPSSMQKRWMPLATIFVEKKFWKKFWCGFRPIRVTPWKEFLISWKKWHFEIFRTALPPRASVVHGWWVVDVSIEVNNFGSN